jgi:uncharacterized glyoxalase superfamily protein PhnB
MTQLTFKYTILYVNNVVETLKFYESAFGFNTKMLHESEGYGELDTGFTTLSFSSFDLMKELGKQPSDARTMGPNFEIAFETPDVAAALSRAIKAGATLEQDTEDMPWGQTVAYVRDINGFLVEFCTPMANEA